MPTNLYLPADDSKAKEFISDKQTKKGLQNYLQTLFLFEVPSAGGDLGEAF